MNRELFTPLILLIVFSIFTVSSGLFMSECSRIASQHEKSIDRFIGRLNCSLHKIDNAKRNFHAKIVNFKQGHGIFRKATESSHYPHRKSVKSSIEKTNEQHHKDLQYPIDIRMSHTFDDYDGKHHRVVRQAAGSFTDI